jgi:hypothetical protein
MRNAHGHLANGSELRRVLVSPRRRVSAGVPVAATAVCTPTTCVGVKCKLRPHAPLPPWLAGDHGTLVVWWVKVHTVRQREGLCHLGRQDCVDASCGKKRRTTTQFPRRVIKEKAEVRQSQGSVPPAPHRHRAANNQTRVLPCNAPFNINMRRKGWAGSDACMLAASRHLQASAGVTVTAVQPQLGAPPGHGRLQAVQDAFDEGDVLHQVRAARVVGHHALPGGHNAGRQLDAGGEHGPNLGGSAAAVSQIGGWLGRHPEAHRWPL